MEKEKVVLGNDVEVSYDSITKEDTRLVICVIGGDIAELEQIFRSAGQTNLEVIRQLDADGGEQGVHERFDIFSAITKKIAEDEANDAVEVVLEQETEVDMKIRHLQEVTDTLLIAQLA